MTASTIRAKPPTTLSAHLSPRAKADGEIARFMDAVRRSERLGRLTEAALALDAEEQKEAA